MSKAYYAVRGAPTLIACKYLGLVASFACIVWTAAVAVGQTTEIDSHPAIAAADSPKQTSEMAEAILEPNASPIWEIPIAPPSEEGITVSMLNGKSRLKIFGSLSALTVFSTNRPYAPGLPLFLLPDSPFGLDTNTFDIHGRQSNIGASFIGPEANGFTPSATFVAFIAKDTLTGDSYGLLPYNAYGELKNEDWRFAAGLQNDVFNPRKPTGSPWQPCSPQETQAHFAVKQGSNDSSSRQTPANTPSNSP
jgi:hypothetical protein